MLIAALAGFTIGSVSAVAGMYVLGRKVKSAVLDEPRDR